MVVPPPCSTRRRKRRKKRPRIPWNTIPIAAALPIIFWNILQVVEQHNRVTTSTTEIDYSASSSSSPFAPLSKIPSISNRTNVVGPTTPVGTPSLASPVQEMSFIYANMTYRFRYYSPNSGDREKITLNKMATRSIRRKAVENNNIDSTADRQQSLSLPKVLFGVLSTSSRGIRRDAIRSTWGSNVPMLFLVAEPFDNIKKIDALMSEFREHGDLLWLDVPENYRNALTPKTFMFFQYVRRVLLNYELPSQKLPSLLSTSSHEIDYIFKTDDDVWVNTTEISVELMTEQYPAYFGKNMSGAPLRDQSAKVGAKWVLSKEEYPRNDYPPYASGLGYALSTTGNVLLDPNSSCLDNTMSSMRPMPWEDVATGLLSEACNVPLTSAFNYWTDTGNNTRNEFLPWEPYETYKDGVAKAGVTIKIIHKPRPHWYGPPLLNGQSLAEANAKFEEQRKRMRQAQRAKRKEQQLRQHQ